MFFNLLFKFLLAKLIRIMNRYFIATVLTLGKACELKAECNNGGFGRVWGVGGGYGGGCGAGFGAGIGFG